MMSRSAITPVVESAEAPQSGIFTVASADHLPDVVLRASESSVLEFKRVSGKMVGKALETLCAFANTDGGTLVLGLADATSGSGTERVCGVEENPEAVDELRRKSATQTDPPLSNVSWRRIPITGIAGRVAHLVLAHVSRSEHVHSILGGGTWMRLGASNRQMSAREITELTYRRGDRSAESDVVPVDCDLLDTQTWYRYASARGLLSGDIVDQLIRVGLAEGKPGAVLPRRAAILLLDTESPQAAEVLSRPANQLD